MSEQVQIRVLSLDAIPLTGVGQAVSPASSEKKGTVAVSGDGGSPLVEINEKRETVVDSMADSPDCSLKPPCENGPPAFSMS